MNLKSIKKYLPIFVIFIFGFILRLISVYPYNTIVGFDQARDFFDSTSIILDHHIRIVGPTAGNNANLHHGVLYLYYLLPPLILFGGNIMAAVYWNLFFNALSIVIVYLLGKSLFKSEKVGLISAILVAVSYQTIQYSGWLSNPTVTLFTVPLFFLGMWEYYEGKNYWLPITTLALGLSIQFELFFIYLIPIALILWLILRPKLPSFKLFLFSLATLVLSLSTMILTEIKFHFSGVMSLLGAGDKVGGKLPLSETIPHFFQRFADAFALNLWPQNLQIGAFLAVFIIGFILFKLIVDWKVVETRKTLLFVLIYLFSPAIMLILGYHNAPWFLIGLPPAIALCSGYVISNLRFKILIFLVVAFVVFNNVSATFSSIGKGQNLLEPDASAILSSQLQAIDYTYKSSQGKAFAINTLTNPLYINAIWGYSYNWYGKSNYGYLPSWGGGDQVHPYDTLQKMTGSEKYLYLLMDSTFRIPPNFKDSLIEWADKISKVTDEKTFGGITVQKRIINN